MSDKIEMRTVHIGVVRCAVHSYGDGDAESLEAGIVSGPIPAAAEWHGIEELLDGTDGHSPIQRFVVEVELPFRPTFVDMDVVRTAKVRLVPKLVEDTSAGR